MSPSPSLTSHITVTTFSPWPWVWQRPGSSTWSRDVGECGRPGLASHSGPLLTCSSSAFAMSQSGAVFSLFYGPIVHLSQQLTLCLCVVFAGSLFAEGACTRAILTDEVFCHRQLGGECAQSWTRVKAPERGAPRLCARCVRVSTQHTVTTADSPRLGTLDTELPQGGNNRAWPFLGAVFYRKYCVETCQAIWRTSGLVLSSGAAMGSYS